MQPWKPAVRSFRRICPRAARTVGRITRRFSGAPVPPPSAGLRAPLPELRSPLARPKLRLEPDGDPRDDARRPAIACEAGPARGLEGPAPISMPAYLSRLRPRRRLGGHPVQSFAVIRSRSPIAERDQRLRLTDAEWGFDGSFPASEAAFGEMTAPIEWRLRRRNGGASRTPPPLPHQAPENRVQASPSPIEISRCTGVAAGSGDPATAREPLKAVREHRPAPTGSALVIAGSVNPALANRVRRTSKLPPATDSRSARTHGTAARQHRSLDAFAGVDAPPGSCPAGETDPTEPAVFQSKPRRLDEPATAIDVRSPARHSVPARSSESLGKAPAGHGEMAPVKTSLDPAPSGVVIGRIEVEVVPLTKEKAVAKTAPRQPVRSGPISQIGPLRRSGQTSRFRVRQR